MASSSTLPQDEVEEIDEDYEKKFVSIISLLKSKTNVLLHGPGGTGKTYMITNRIYKKLVKDGKTVFCTATTGVSAIGLNNPKQELVATTLHSWAGIGLAKESREYLAAKVKGNRDVLDRWIKCDVLIIDEIGMLDAILLKKIDYIARTVRRRDEPFGGITLLVSCDFLQLPPVQGGWAFSGKVWKELNFTPVIFDKPKRYPDEEYFKLLLRLRKGEHTPEDVKVIRSRVAAYKEITKRFKENKSLNVIKPTTLYSTKKDVHAFNLQELEALPTEEHVFEAKDEFILAKGAREESYRYQLDNSAPELLTLKIGAQVMLTTNLNVKCGLANGSRGVVTDIREINLDDVVGDIHTIVTMLGTKIVTVRFLNGRKEDITIKTWESKDKKGMATRRQIPLILAWSLTIHKVQGCTLDFGIIDMGRSVFANGQAYVAMSRVRSLTGLFISSFVEESIKVDSEALEYTKEIEKKAKAVLGE